MYPSNLSRISRNSLPCKGLVRTWFGVVRDFPLSAMCLCECVSCVRLFSLSLFSLCLLSACSLLLLTRSSELSKWYFDSNNKNKTSQKTNGYYVLTVVGVVSGEWWVEGNR